MDKQSQTHQIIPSKLRIEESSAEPAPATTNGSTAVSKTKVSASYKTFSMVQKLLENGSVTKQFFDRYKDELATNNLVIRDTQETIPEVDEDYGDSMQLKKRKNVIIKNTRGVKRN